MKNRIAVLISLLVFIFVASTVQAQDIDTIVSPLASPLPGAHVVAVDPPPNYNGVILRMIKFDWSR